MFCLFLPVFPQFSYLPPICLPIFWISGSFYSVADAIASVEVILTEQNGDGFTTHPSRTVEREKFFLSTGFDLIREEIADHAEE